MTEQKTILIVDDDMDYLFQMKLHIKKMGYIVVTAEGQREGEEAIEKIKPDLAIFDLMMERDDSGFILCYKIKRKHPDVPVILATAVASETGISFDIDSSMHNSWIKADRYLEKGLSPEQLKMEINKLLEK